MSLRNCIDQWKLASTLIVALMVMSVGLCVTTSSASAWSSSCLAGPTSVYTGEANVFEFDFKNTGSSSIDIKSIYLSFDWPGNPAYPITTSIVTVPVGETHKFYSPSITVTQSSGTYKMYWDVNARANGELWDSSYKPAWNIEVGIRPDLSLTIVPSISTGNSPLQVSFTPQCSGGTPDYTFSWSFGDGGSSSSASPSHTYSQAGTYAVTCVLTDAMSRQISATTSIIVKTPISIQASADKTEGVGSLTVKFTSIASGGSPTYSYYWDFGDGEYSSEQSPSHTYDIPGNYTARVTITDSASNQKTYPIAISVKEDTSGLATLGGTGNIILIGVVLAVIVGIIAAYAILRRKRAVPPPRIMPPQNQPPQ